MRVVRVETDLEKVPPSLWVNDSKSNLCNVCKDQIIGGWIFSNKHHCRYCGHIVCTLCSNHAIFDTQNKSNYHRICDICYKNTIKSEKTKTKIQTNTIKPTNTTPTQNQSTNSETDSSSSQTSPSISPIPIPLHSIREIKRQLTIDYTDKYINNNTYCVNRRDILVKSYIRLNKTININLPIDIINLIIKWSYINDTWNTYNNKNISKHLLITNCNQSIERISDNNQHCYYSFGTEIITNNNIKQWIIRIDNINYYTNNYCSMLLGIAEKNKINWIKSLLGDFTYGSYNGYGLRIATKSRFANKHFKKDIFIQKGCLRKGDIIKIKLDLMSTNGKLCFHFYDNCGKKIKYGINDNYKWSNHERNVAFDNIDKNKKYVLVCGMYSQNKMTFLEECNALT